MFRNLRRKFRLALASTLGASCAVLAFPMPDTTPPPVVQKVEKTAKASAAEAVEKRAKERQAKKEHQCTWELEDRAVQCRITEDNKVCQKWMDLSRYCSK